MSRTLRKEFQGAYALSMNELRKTAKKVGSPYVETMDQAVHPKTVHRVATVLINNADVAFGSSTSAQTEGLDRITRFLELFDRYDRISGLTVARHSLEQKDSFGYPIEVLKLWSATAERIQPRVDHYPESRESNRPGILTLHLGLGLSGAQTSYAQNSRGMYVPLPDPRKLHIPEITIASLRIDNDNVTTQVNSYLGWIAVPDTTLQV